MGYVIKVVDDNGSYSTFNGCTTCGFWNNLNYANFNGPLLMGGSATLGLNNNYKAPIIAGDSCSFTVKDNHAPIIAGTNFKFLSGQNAQASTTYIIGKTTQIIDEYITTRRGLILTTHNDNIYHAYWPNQLNYSAQFHGYVRYTNEMNITDPDGEYIIQNGKLNGHLLTDEEYQLFLKMKEILADQLS